MTWLHMNGILALASLGLVLGCTGQVAPAGSGSGEIGSGSGGNGEFGAGGGGEPGNPALPGTGSASGAGASGAGGAVSPNPNGTGGTAGPLPMPGNPAAAGLRPLRLLSTREYLNTVRDLLADTGMSADALPSDTEDPASSFPFHTRGDVATLDASLFRDAAHGLATRAVTHLGTLLPCSTSVTTSGANDTACLNTFFSTLALRMYRRPLTAGDKAALMPLYTLARAAAPTGLGLGFGDAIGFVIEAIVQSPEFLYHWEIEAGKATVDPLSPAGSTVVKMGGYELANRLSYFLWGSMPDQALFDAAAAGSLGDAASLETQARRMLKDAKASAMFADFFVDWLDIDTLVSKAKDKVLYPSYGDSLATAMAGEVQSFVSAIMTTGTGRFDEVMTGTNSFVNGALAGVYGLSGVSGVMLQPVALNPAQRSGLLTTAGFMALTGASDGSLPPRRGGVILKKLLCRTLPPPPAVIPDPQPVTPGLTTRQRFEQHATNPCATACHTLIDPLGFAFENYDGIGQYRNTDNSLPVNSQVTLTLDGRSQTVADARGLVMALAGSDEAQSCFSRQWFRYALRRLDTADDLASVNTATATFKAATRDIRELLVGIVTSRTFRYRALSQGEVVQ